MEDVLSILNTGDPHHIGACQTLGKAVLMFAIERFLDVWDIHTVRRARDHGERWVN